MKEKEFNLSEKVDTAGNYGGQAEVLFAEDVKEFIRRLKEELKKFSEGGDEWYLMEVKIMDKLAGPKLTK